MPLPATEFTTLLALSRQGASGPASATLYSKASARQQRAADAVRPSTRAPTRASQKDSTRGNAKRATVKTNILKKTAPATSSKRKLDAHSKLRAVAKHPLYSRLHEASFGRFPIPRPHHTVGSTLKLAYPKASSAWSTISLAAGDYVVIYPTPYHGKIAAKAVNGYGGTPSWTILQAMVGGGAYTQTTQAFSQFRQNWATITAPNILSNDGDLDGFHCVPASLIDNHTERQTALPYAQLLGGSLNVEVSCPYDAFARVTTLHHNEDPSFSGDAANKFSIRRPSVDPPGFDCVLSLPTHVLSAVAAPDVVRSFGSVHNVAGNKTVNFKIGLPHDRSWYHPGLPWASTGTGVNTYIYDNGFQTTQNPMINFAYGVVLVENTSSVPITISFNAEMTHACTYPDIADETVSTVADPLRMSMLAKAKAVAQNVLTSVKSGVGKSVTQGTSRDTKATNISLANDDHHTSVSDEAGVAIGGAGLEAQTGFLRSAFGKVKGFFSKGVSEVESFATRAGPTIEEVLEPATEAALMIV